jgi:MT0933-like antitoxin protein
MPLMRKLTVLAGMAEAARRYARNNPDKVNKLVDKAGRFVDKRTKGKYHGKIDSAVRKIRTSTSNSNSRWPHR